MKPSHLFSGVARRRVAMAASLVLLLIGAMLLLFVRQPLFLRQLDNRIYDVFLLSSPREKPLDVSVIIDIDEESLAKYGQWPWPRYRIAALLDAAVARGAAAVAFDILLAEPDRASPDNLVAALREDLGLDISFSGLPEEFSDNDKFLAQIMRERPVVLGMYARFGTEAHAAGKEADKGPQPAPVGHIERSKPGYPPIRNEVLKAAAATSPLRTFQEVAPTGLINMSPDSDGFVRRVPMLIFVDQKPYVSLSLRALMVAMGRKQLVSEAGPDGLERLRVGPYTVPVSPEGNFMVPFTGPRGEYPYISAAQVMDNSLPPDAFAGKILFVGTSAPGLLDIRATPFDRVYPGVEVHAAVLDAILASRSIVTPPWTPGLIALLIVGGGIMAGFAFSFARPQVYVAFGATFFCGVVGGSWWLFGKGIYISPLYPALTMTVQGVAMLVLRFWQEERQKILLRRAFSRYVAPEVVKRITERQGDLLSGEERELTIMFTDIRGFSSISENLSPRQVVSLLSRYFTPMTALVRNNGGTLDKFIGDALMAFWNAPFDVANHPFRALQTALAMHRELRILNEGVEADFGCRLRMGVGLHTGKVYVGNMGSEELVNYTLIGDNVNLASRLEGVCALFGLSIALSEETMRFCEAPAEGQFAFQPVDTLRVKGRAQPVKVYTAMQMEEYVQRATELAAFEAALATYHAGDFGAASQAFAALEKEYPGVGLYAAYGVRVNELRINPPQAWDGIWNLGAK